MDMMLIPNHFRLLILPLWFLLFSICRSAGAYTGWGSNLMVLGKDKQALLKTRSKRWIVVFGKLFTVFSIIMLLRSSLGEFEGIAIKQSVMQKLSSSLEFPL